MSLNIKKKMYISPIYMLTVIFMQKKSELDILSELINVIKENPKHSKIESNILFNIFNLSNNFFKIEKNLNNIQTIVTIARTVIDYYSVYNLLFLIGTDEEQSLRQKLYLCDGYNSFVKTSEIFNEIDKKKLLKKSNEISLNSIDIIKETFPVDFKKYCTTKHLNNYQWKFKSNTKYENYSWKELYELSFQRKIIAKMISEYFSLYIHGLSIQSIKYENEYFLNGTIDLINNTINLLNSNLIKKPTINY